MAVRKLIAPVKIQSESDGQILASGTEIDLLDCSVCGPQGVCYQVIKVEGKIYTVRADELQASLDLLR